MPSLTVTCSTEGCGPCGTRASMLASTGLMALLHAIGPLGAWWMLGVSKGVAKAPTEAGYLWLAAQDIAFFIVARAAQNLLSFLYGRKAAVDQQRHVEGLLEKEGYWTAKLFSGRKTRPYFESWRELQLDAFSAAANLVMSLILLVHESLWLALMSGTLVLGSVGCMAACIYFQQPYCKAIEKRQRVLASRDGDLFKKASRGKRNIAREARLVDESSWEVDLLTLKARSIGRCGGVIAALTHSVTLILIALPLIREGRYAELLSYEWLLLIPIWDLCRLSFDYSDHLDSHYGVRKALTRLVDHILPSVPSGPPEVDLEATQSQSPSTVHGVDLEAGFAVSYSVPKDRGRKTKAEIEEKEKRRPRCPALGGLASFATGERAPLLAKLAKPMRTLFRLDRVAIPKGMTLFEGIEGTGKSTLSKLLSGLLDSGRLYAPGVEQSALAAVTVAMDQHTPMPAQPIIADDYFGADRMERVMRHARALGIESLLGEGGDTYIHGEDTGGFSGGESKQIAFLKALSEIEAPCEANDWHGTEILTLDEPDTGLSESSALRLYHYVQSLTRGEAPVVQRVIYVSHQSAVQRLACESGAHIIHLDKME